MRKVEIMLKLIMRTVLLSALMAVCWACSASYKSEPVTTSSPSSGSAPAPAPPPAAASGNLRYQAPSEWKSETPTSNMRAAQFLLPKAASDPEDASLVLYYFGQGQGGSVQANLDRWVGQMQQPDGSSSRDKARTETMKANGLNITLLDVSGTYTAEMTPGAGDRQNKSNYRMRAAVIETPRGPYFIKLTGPAKTIDQWDASFMSFVNSMEFK